MVSEPPEIQSEKQIHKSIQSNMASSSSVPTNSNPLIGVQITEKLSKQNHGLWMAQVLTAIRGARLEGHINGKSVTPPAEITVTVDGKETKSPNPQYEQWFVEDQQILGFLFSSLTRETFSQVAAARTAADAWKTLDEMFTSRTRARSLNVRLALTTTQKGNLSISEYVGKMRTLSDEVVAAGKPLDDEELIAYILNGLDEEFDSVVSTIVGRAEPITVVETFSQLLSFENRLSMRRTQASANTANRSGRGGGGFMSQGGSTNAARGRGANRGRGSPGRGRGGSNQQRSNDSRPFCQVCYKRGHVAADCWHRFDEDYVPDEKNVAAAIHSRGQDANWYVDTGATDHITSELDKLTARDVYKGHDQIHTASGVGSGHEEYCS